MSIGKNKMAETLIDMIQKQSEKQIEETKLEYQQREQIMLKHVKDQVDEECRIYIENELHDLKSEISSNTAEAKWKLKKSVFKRRNELTSQLFQFVENDLIAFCDTPEYPVYLKKALAGCSAENILEGSIISCTARDTELLRKLVGTANADVQPSELVHIGGFMCFNKNKSIEADFTLDGQLEKQREWFTYHSQLIV